MNNNLIMIKKIYLFLACSILTVGGLFSCSNDDSVHELSTSAYILEVQAKTDMGEIALPITGDEILINLPENVDLGTIDVNIKVSEGATISPDPSIIRDWSYKHTFTVTAANGDTRTYYTILQLEDMGKVFDGSVRLSSQQEVDGFGSNGFTSVGDIYIYQETGAARITDFSALKTIKEIKGQLVINHVNCRTVDFSNLERLGKLLFHSPAVTKILMPNLKFVTDDYIVGVVPVGQIPQAHDEMTDIVLSSLEYVGGSLEFNYVTKIASLESLSNLTEIGKNFNLIGGSYTSLKGIEKIKHLKGSMTVFAKKTSLEGFSIEEIDGNLNFQSIENAASIKPLQSLKRVGGILSIGNNYNITNLEGIENIDVKNLEIKNLLGLTSLQGISKNAEINSLTLSSLTALTSVKELSTLKKVTTRLMLQNLASLTSLEGLENIEDVGDIVISFNPELESIGSLSPNIKVQGYLDITNCVKINSLSNLSSITSLGGLRLRGLGALTSLNGLQNLTKVTQGGVFIESNNTLTDISALSNLQEIGFYLQADKFVLRSNRLLGDFCSVSDLIKRYAPISKVTLSSNYYNPTLANFNSGNCSGGVGGAGISGGR
jgi:hypothetical protein